jgi:DNA-binding MarR family transcriptional regulator
MPKAPAPPDDPERLTALMHVLHRFSVEATGTVDAALGTDFLSNSAIRFACALFRSGPLTTARVGEVTGLRRGAAARVVAQFERLGLARRATSDQDRRAVLVRATPAGLRAADRLEDAFDRFLLDARPLAKEALDLLLPGQADGHEDRSDPLVTDDPIALLDAMGAAGNELNGTIRARLGDEHVDGRQQIALLVLLRLGAVRPGQLADELALSSGGLTYLVDRLEAAGKVSRSYGAVETDRRAILIDLTDSGRAAALTTTRGAADAAPALERFFRAALDYRSS